MAFSGRPGGPAQLRAGPRAGPGLAGPDRSCPRGPEPLYTVRRDHGGHCALDVRTVIIASTCSVIALNVRRFVIVTGCQPVMRQGNDFSFTDSIFPQQNRTMDMNAGAACSLRGFG